MNKMQEQVREFHQEMGLEWADYPHMISSWAKAFRITLISEELEELNNALLDGDMQETVDALCDILYVTFGTAVELGIDLEPFFNEVHRSNMTKDGGKRRADGKLFKPEGYDPPDLLYVAWDEYSMTFHEMSYTGEEPYDDN